MFDLSQGALTNVKNGQLGMVFTVQVLGVKALANGKFQLVLFDGVDRMAGMAASQLSGLCADQTIRPESVLKVNQYVCSDVGGTKLIIIMSCDMLGYQPLPGGAAAGTTAPGQQAQVPAAQPAAASYGNAPAASYPPVAAYPPVPSAAATATPAYQPSSTSAAYGGAGGAGLSYGGGAGGMSRPVVQQMGDTGAILPINVINPYSNKWTIKARITNKSDVRHWRNAKGEGCLFSIDLLDSHGGEIRATFFKESCDKWHPVLAEGKVYTFSGGTVKVSQNQRFTSIKNQYELTFNANSVIQPAQEDGQIGQQTFHFMKIDALTATDVGATIDVIGFVKAAGEVTEIVSQKLQGKVLQKRELTIMDDTQSEVRLTLWGDKAASSMYDWASTPIAAFKGVRVGDFGGRTLGTSASTSILLNPQIPEGKALFDWLMKEHNGQLPNGTSLSTGGGGNSNDSLENRLPILSLKEGSMGLGEKPDYASVKGVVSYVKHDSDPWYEACPGENCNKKVIATSDGSFMCEKCNRTYPECNRRFILNLTLQDSSGNTWVTMFDDLARQMLGVSAQELFEKRSVGDEAGYEEVFRNLLFKPFTARVRVKQEHVNDEMRIKVTAMNTAPLNYVRESQQLLDAINAASIPVAATE